MRSWPLFLLFFWTSSFAQRFPNPTISDNPLSSRIGNYQVRFHQVPTTGLIDIDVSIHWTFSPKDLTKVIDEIYLTLDPQSAGLRLIGKIVFSDTLLDELPAQPEEIIENRLYRIPLREPCFVGKIVALRFRLQYEFQQTSEELFLKDFFPKVPGCSEDGWLIQPSAGRAFPFGTFLVELPIDCPKPETSMVAVPWMEHAYYGADVTTIGLVFSPSTLNRLKTQQHEIECSVNFDAAQVAQIVDELEQDGMEYSNIRLVLIQGELNDNPSGIVTAPDMGRVKVALIDHYLRHQVGLFEKDSAGLIIALAEYLARNGVVETTTETHFWPFSWGLREQTAARPVNLFLAMIGQMGPSEVLPCLDWCNQNAFALHDVRELVRHVWPTLLRSEPVSAPNLTCSAVSSRGYFYRLSKYDSRSPSPWLVTYGRNSWRLVTPSRHSKTTPLHTPEPIQTIFWDPMQNKSHDIDPPDSMTFGYEHHANKRQILLMEWLRSAFL